VFQEIQKACHRTHVYSPARWVFVWYCSCFSVMACVISSSVAESAGQRYERVCSFLPSPACVSAISCVDLHIGAPFEQQPRVRGCSPEMMPVTVPARLSLGRACPPRPSIRLCNRRNTSVNPASHRFPCPALSRCRHILMRYTASLEEQYTQTDLNFWIIDCS